MFKLQRALLVKVVLSTLYLREYKLDLEVDYVLYKRFQDKNDTKVLMWIGKQVVLSLIEKEIFCIWIKKLNIKYLSGTPYREISKMLRTPVSYRDESQ